MEVDNGEIVSVLYVVDCFRLNPFGKLGRRPFLVSLEQLSRDYSLNLKQIARQTQMNYTHQ